VVHVWGGRFFRLDHHLDRFAKNVEALAPLLNDRRRAHEIGARARAAAEAHFDWSVVGDRIADEVLRREG